MPIPLMALGAVASGVGSLARGIFGGKQNKKANQINPQWHSIQPLLLLKANLH
jgi:hypothetical protein